MFNKRFLLFVLPLLVGFAVPVKMTEMAYDPHYEEHTTPQVRQKPTLEKLHQRIQSKSQSVNDMDQRRCLNIMEFDEDWQSEQLAGDEGRGWFRLERDWQEHNYINKALSIFALGDECGGDTTRYAEANGLLRYAMFQRWRSGANGAVWGSGSDAWMHTSGSVAIRIYYFYRDLLEDDIRTEFERRLDYLSTRAIQETGTENIKLSVNTMLFLARDLRGSPFGDFEEVRESLRQQLQIHIDHGFWEWGSNYLDFTYSALQNLAEFTQDPIISRQAKHLWDYFLFQSLANSNGSYYATAGTRMYRWGAIRPFVHYMTQMQAAYFGPKLPYNGSGGSLSGLYPHYSVTNLMPLQAHQSLHDKHEVYGVRSKQGSFDGLGSRGELYEHSMYFYNGIDYSISSIQRYSRVAGSHHTWVHWKIQSNSSGHSWIIPWTFPLNDRRSGGYNQRAFGLRNVVMYNDGGTAFRDPEGLGDNLGNLPAKIFVPDEFTVELAGCRAFMTDGKIYVAWMPSKGDPKISDNLNDGRILKSSWASGDAWGERVTVEVGDADSFLSYEAFKNSVINRLGGECPRVNGGKVQWKVQREDGGLDTIDYGTEDVSVNGVVQDENSFPRHESPYLTSQGYQDGELDITFDHNNHSMMGSIDRMQTELEFGTTELEPREPCGPADDTLCLHGNRFQLKLRFKESPDHPWERGKKIRHTTDTGHFYFFSPSNIEVAVKMLNANTFNGKFWVFHSALTSLQYELEIIDTMTGQRKVYQKNNGSACGDADSLAFPTYGEDPQPPESFGAGNTQATDGLCVPGSDRLCLLGGKFEAKLKVTLPDGSQIDANKVEDLGTDRSGMFYFFAPSNVEFLMKVLDARDYNNHYWVFFTSLTTLDYQLTVTNLENGDRKVYNSPGATCGVQDTTAFD